MLNIIIVNAGTKTGTGIFIKLSKLKWLLIIHDLHKLPIFNRARNKIMKS